MLMYLFSKYLVALEPNRRFCLSVFKNVMAFHLEGTGSSGDKWFFFAVISRSKAQFQIVCASHEWSVIVMSFHSTLQLASP